MQHNLLINGKLVAGEGEKVPVYNPATGEVILEIAEATAAQVDAAVEAPERQIDRAGVALDRRLLLHVPHDDVEAVRAGDDHRRREVGPVGALDAFKGDQPVHQDAGGHHGHLAERPGLDLPFAR